MLTFVIPVRHPANARDWALNMSLLGLTAAAIARQSSHTWRAVVVANDGADLPPLPAGFAVKRVDFPPNRQHDEGDDGKEAFFEAVRRDKGRRILAGLLHAAGAGHFMVVDDDDLVHRELAAFVDANARCNGWYFQEGYVWASGDSWMYRQASFHMTCGTSHIIRADLLLLPPSFEQASDAYVNRRLGSHIFIEEDLRREGSPLEPLPFAGAVYRVGHANSHSRSSNQFRSRILKKRHLREPLRLLRELSRMQRVDREARLNFFGSGPAQATA